MKKTYKKLLSSILAAGMIANIASFPVFAGFLGVILCDGYVTEL